MKDKKNSQTSASAWRAASRRSHIPKSISRARGDFRPGDRVVILENIVDRKRGISIPVTSHGTIVSKQDWHKWRVRADVAGSPVVELASWQLSIIAESSV